MGVGHDAPRLADLTSPALERLLSGPPLAALVSVGSVEPHGPHLPLGTDTTISAAAASRAAQRLAERGIPVTIAPAVPYGVTECAAGFPGAVSIPAAALTAYLRGVVDGLLATGVAHVCLINNHLEPAHDAAVRAAVDHLRPGSASVACPLRRRWARTLSDEFKRGECHAGRYETSIVLVAAPERVDEPTRSALPEVPISLSQQLQAGVTDFRAMGLDRGYAGAPAAATVEEGEAMLDRLAEMIATTVEEAMSAAPG